MYCFFDTKSRIHAFRNDGYHVARPHGTLAGTSTHYYVACITASLVDVGWWPVQGRFLTTAPRRRAACGGVLDRLLLIWFRLVLDAGKLRCSNHD
jgi:hypothetical protein